MSYSTIKAIYPGEKHENLKELRNAWGTAPLVWGVLAKKYLGAETEFAWHEFAADNRLWDLWKRSDIPEEYRLVLMFTFDGAYVRRKDYPRMAAAIRKFMQDFPVKQECVNHWPALAELFESNPDIPGIGLYCTSVSEDPFQGPWNEKKEEHDPPDWSQIYDIGTQIDGLAAPGGA